MRSLGRLSPFLLTLTLATLPRLAAGAPPPANVEFPNLSTPLDAEKSEFDAPMPTVTQERMTLPELRSFFDTLDRGVAVRLVYRNGSEYAGNYSGGDTDHPRIYCRKGVAAPEAVPLETVIDAYVFVTDTHLVRIHREE